MPPTAVMGQTSILMRSSDQYFYKLSKTYLKDNGTNTIVDPIFGFSGDIVRTTARLSMAPRQSLPPAPRSSHTALRSDAMPSTFQSPAESQSRFYQPSPLQNTSSADSSTGLHLEMYESKLKLQDDKITAQEQTLRQQDTQIRLLTALLETLQSTVEDLKKSMRELQAQKTGARNGITEDDDAMNALESMLKDMRHSETSRAELDKLRAENNMMRVRLEDSEPSTRASTGSPNTSSMLGKRKRYDGLPRSGACKSRGSAVHGSPSFHETSSLNQMPTPRSSNPSDNQSQGASTPSRDLTPEEHHDVLPQPSDEAEPHLGSPADPVTEQGEGDSNAQDQVYALDADPAAQFSTRDEPTMEHSSGVAEGETSLPRVSTPPMNEESSFDNGDGQDDTEMPQSDINKDMRTETDTVEVVPAHIVTICSPPADNVEFSDEEHENVPTWQIRDGRETHDHTASSIVPPNSGNEPVHHPEPRTRRQTRRSSAAKRVAETATNGRDAAPEPAPIPRTIPRRLEMDGFAKVVTPESLQEKEALKNSGRKPKRMQHTTKMLHRELIELGLQEWIYKDRKCAEYREIVSEARKRKREENKLAKLVNAGANVDVVAATAGTDDLPSPSDLIQRSFGSLDEAFQAATEALLDGDTGRLKAMETVHPPRSNSVDLKISNAQPTDTGGTDRSVSLEERELARLKQRQEEIRRRDQLAKEAMEMSD